MAQGINSKYRTEMRLYEPSKCEELVNYPVVFQLTQARRRKIKFQANDSLALHVTVPGSREKRENSQ